MLDFLWPARSEHGFDSKSSSLLTPAASPLTHPSAPNQLKRKRDQSKNAIARLNSDDSLERANKQDAHTDSVVPYPSPHPANPPPAATHSESEAGTTKVRTDLTPTHALPKPASSPEYEANPAAGDRDLAQPLDIVSTMSDTFNQSDALRDAVETQFNLEILIRSRELRLIEQELAKCQVAYEQIRRCQVIPFPSQATHGTDMAAVSSGMGVSYSNSAPHAAPWGVAEGPYSRHYNSWLINDSKFDSAFVEAPHFQPSAGKRLPDRHTRGVHAGKGTFGVPSRSQRNPMSTRMTSQTQEQTDHRFEKGPMIVARKSDGHMVKLVCLDCRRSDFNSVQGFINHCRIAHSRQFVSHEAAIEASGEEVDSENPGLAVAEQGIVRQSTAAALVHPMIRSARPPSPKPAAHKTTRDAASDQLLALNSETSKPSDAHSMRSMRTPQASADFTPSAHTPFLSAFLSKLGRSDNLANDVADAKRTDELDMIESMDIDDSENEDFDLAEQPDAQSHGTRGVVQSSFRPVSSGALKPTTSPPVLAQNRRGNFQSSIRGPTFENMKWSPPTVDTNNLAYGNHDGPVNDLASPSPNLSPGVTDPNPAPSLVSDDGDYDHTHSDSDLPNSSDLEADDDQYNHPHLFDDDAMDLDDHAPFDFTVPEKANANRFGRRRRASKIDREVGHRHVTFVDQKHVGRPDNIDFADK